MLLKTPKEFERVARQWATLYAGAPSTGNENGDGQEETEGADFDSMAQ